MGKRTAWEADRGDRRLDGRDGDGGRLQPIRYAASVSLVEFGSGVVVAQLAHTKPGSVRVLPAPRTERAASAQAEPGRARSERGVTAE